MAMKGGCRAGCFKKVFPVSFEIMITCIEIGRELFVPAYRDMISESK